MIYDKHYYNIFHEKALYKVGQEIHPVNIFAENDDNMIGDCKNGKSESYKKEDIRNVINRYRMMKIKCHSIDMVTFGLCQSLLEYYNTGTAALKFNDDCNDWKQNTIIRNWINEVPDKKEALSFVLKKYCTELEYCQNRISDYNITIQDLMPLYSNMDWAYEILGLSCNDCAIYKGTVKIDDDYEPYIDINNNDTIAAGMTNQKNSPIYLNSCGFYNDLTDQDKRKYSNKGVEHYIIYNKSKAVWTANPEDESIYRYLARVEVLLKKNSLSYDMCKLVDINNYNDIKSYMRLHEDALMLERENSPFVHFDSMVAYRLIHNLINYKINSSNWTSFKRVIDHHHKLDFEDIANNEVFKRKERGVLYVPKDRLRKDSVLHAVYEEMKYPFKRDSNNIYDPNIRYDITCDRKYDINGHEIRKIIFLSDNICVGTATCNTVAFYIGQEKIVANNWDEKRKDEFRNSLQTYTVNNKSVTVEDIIKTNNIVNIAVYSYYGTELGKKKVEKMLAVAGYKNATVDYAEEINKWSEDIKEDLIKLKYIKEDKFTNICTIIRKFNQPKKNVFPNEMLDDARKAICLFVKKKEVSIYKISAE